MAEHAVLREVSLTLPMVADMELAATQTVTSVAESMDMSPDKVDEVRMAVVEACINAFEHSKAADRKVYLTFAVLGTEEPEQLRITVRDSGGGFDVTQVKEPKMIDKVKAARKRGWGLKIIKGLMDDVEVQSGSDGTTVVMSKAR